MVDDSHEAQPVEMLHYPDGKAGWGKLRVVKGMNKDGLVAYAQMKMDDPNAWWRNDIVAGVFGG